MFIITWEIQSYIPEAQGLDPFCSILTHLKLMNTSSFLLGLFFDTDDGGDMSLRNVGGLHGVISQKTEIFITTAVRTSKTHTV
jgi:hypothetical protein